MEWGTIYLLHFERPISELHTTQHYTGWAADLEQRIADHRAGRGARLTQVAIERGIGFEVVRTWPGTRAFERQLKRRKAAPRLCPHCCRRHIPARACAGEQLVLDLDADPWPLAPLRQPDRYELAYFANRPALDWTHSPDAESPDLLLPY